MLQRFRYFFVPRLPPADGESQSVLDIPPSRQGEQGQRQGGVEPMAIPREGRRAMEAEPLETEQSLEQERQPWALERAESYHDARRGSVWREDGLSTPEGVKKGNCSAAQSGTNPSMLPQLKTPLGGGGGGRNWDGQEGTRKSKKFGPKTGEVPPEGSEPTPRDPQKGTNMDSEVGFSDPALAPFPALKSPARRRGGGWRTFPPK